MSGPRNNLDTFTEPPVCLQDERNKINYNVRNITYFLNGGKKATDEMEKFMLAMERDPVFNNDSIYDLTKENLRELAIKRIARMTQYLESTDETEMRKRISIMGLVDMGSQTRLGVHYGLFLGAVRGSGTDKQFSYWISQGAANLHRFYGCFAMTEIGHGSNVAGLETIAELDKQTDEFVINTPHAAATKWWVGGAAHSATHCVLYARLVVDGKDHGVKNFVVPLRDTLSHSLLPGVAIGDIGKKMGRDAIDNGWIQFTDVRIPREYLLMRYTVVSRDGRVKSPPLEQLSYGALVGARVSMVMDSFNISKRFTTIAIRYAAARRQFSSSNTSRTETKLLDYASHQRRIITRLSLCYAMRCSATGLNALATKSTQLLQTADPNDKAQLQAAIHDAKQLFSLSAGLKAFTTWAALDLINECRQACGGQGYSAYNGFGQAYDDWCVQCTWEGDNNILALSAGRALIQDGLAVQKGQNLLSESASFLKTYKENTTFTRKGPLDHPTTIKDAWNFTTGAAVFDAVAKFTDLTNNERLTKDQAYEKLSKWRLEIAKLHAYRHLVSSFFDNIDNEASTDIKPVLTNLAILFGLWSMEENCVAFVRSGCLAVNDISSLTSLVEKYCAVNRVQAVGLTDAFGLSDFFINAPIGNYDGNIYKNYIDKIKRSNPSFDCKPPYYDTLLKPFLHRSFEDIEPLVLPDKT